MNFFNKIKDSIVDWWSDEERDRLAGLEEIRELNRQFNQEQFNPMNDEGRDSDVFIRHPKSAGQQEVGIERDGGQLVKLIETKNFSVLVNDKHPAELEFSIKPMGSMFSNSPLFSDSVENGMNFVDSCVYS